jgi:hypothetical protein
MPFDQTTNLTSLLKPMSKPTAYDISWNFVDGAMFVNDNEFILYGYSDTESSYPLTMLTDVRGLIINYDGDLPAANWTLGYEQDQDGLEPINWMPSFIQNSLPDGLTRYVAGGGAISAPSENLRFYFSGIYAPSWGTIPDGQSAANALITVRMPTRQRPRQIQCRTGLDPSLSQSGVLIAIGGVHYSDALNLNLTAEQAVLSVSLFVALTLSLFSRV